MTEIKLNKDNFEKEVLKSDVPVVVDFWAPWCVPCNMMGPVIAKLANKSVGKYSVGKVNVDEEEDLSEDYNIMSIPSIKIFKNGQVASSFTGVTTLAEIENALAKL